MKIVYFFMALLILFSACNQDNVKSLEPPQSFWQQTAFDSTLITSLAMNSKGTIFAANVSKNSGAYYSNDNGVNWSRLNVPLVNEYIKLLAINSTDEIFAATNNGQNSRLLLSVDEGNWWKSIILPGSLGISSIVFNQKNDIFISSASSDETSPGIYRSEDKGKNWQNISIPGRISVSAITVTQKNHIFAATSRGVFRSKDDGLTWNSMNIGLRDTLVFNIISDVNGNIYASTRNDGIFRFSDNSTEWKQTTLVKPCIETMISDDFGGISVAVGYYQCATPEGIYYTTNEGQDWIHLIDGLPEDYIDSILISPNKDIFVGTWSNGILYGKLPE